MASPGTAMLRSAAATKLPHVVRRRTARRAFNQRLLRPACCCRDASFISSAPIAATPASTVAVTSFRPTSRCAVGVTIRQRGPGPTRSTAHALTSGAPDGLPSSLDPALDKWLKSLLSFLEAQYLPIALLSALLLGATCPGPGLLAAKTHVPAVATFGIFLVQGLQLRRREAASALSARAEIAYGLAAILLITPLMGLAVARLPLEPRPLAFGLGVVCTVPTALACGVAFVQQLGGNVSLALLLTVTSNILGIFTMPWVLPHIVSAAALGSSSAFATSSPGATAAAATATAVASGPLLEPLSLMLQLCQTILLPTLLGACVRGFVPGAAEGIDRRRKLLAYINAGLLASVPWMQISKTASSQMAVDASAVVATAAAAVGLHALLLAVNTLGCRLLRLGGSDPTARRAVRRALIISASVKTLPVAVTVLAKLGPALGEAVVGIAMLPVVFYQLTQIIWESVMVSRWLAGDVAEARAAAAARASEVEEATKSDAVALTPGEDAAAAAEEAPLAVEANIIMFDARRME